MSLLGSLLTPENPSTVLVLPALIANLKECFEKKIHNELPVQPSGCQGPRCALQRPGRSGSAQRAGSQQWTHAHMHNNKTTHSCRFLSLAAFAEHTQGYCTLANGRPRPLPHAFTPWTPTNRKWICLSVCQSNLSSIHQSIYLSIF